MITSADEMLEQLEQLKKEYARILENHQNGDITEDQAQLETLPVVVEMLQVYDLLATMTQAAFDAAVVDVQTLSELVDTLTADTRTMRAFISAHGLDSQYREFVAKKQKNNVRPFKKGGARRGK